MARRSPDEIRDIVEQITSRRQGWGIPPIPYRTRGKGPQKATDEQIARALIQTGGRRSYASIILGISPTALKRRIDKSEYLSELVDNIQEARIDVAESKLDKKISEERWQAIQFLLETQGKSRGYVKRQEVTGAEGNNLVFEFSDGHRE